MKTSRFLRRDGFLSSFEGGVVELVQVGLRVAVHQDLDDWLGYTAQLPRVEERTHHMKKDVLVFLVALDLGSQFGSELVYEHAWELLRSFS